MKKKILYIYDFLDNFKDKLISKKEIEKIICDVGQHDLEKILKNLRQNKKIKHIFLNYYYILSEEERKKNYLKYTTSEIIYVILNKQNIKWYITLEKGLELNNILWQAHNKTTIFNNKISKKKIIDKSIFEFKKIYLNPIIKQNKTPNRITQNIGTNKQIYLDYKKIKKEIPIELKETLKNE